MVMTDSKRPRTLHIVGVTHLPQTLEAVREDLFRAAKSGLRRIGLEGTAEEINATESTRVLLENIGLGYGFFNLLAKTAKSLNVSVLPLDNLDGSAMSTAIIMAMHLRTVCTRDGVDISEAIRGMEAFQVTPASSIQMPEHLLSFLRKWTSIALDLYKRSPQELSELMGNDIRIRSRNMASRIKDGDVEMAITGYLHATEIAEALRAEYDDIRLHFIPEKGLPELIQQFKDATSTNPEH